MTPSEEEFGQCGVEGHAGEPSKRASNAGAVVDSGDAHSAEQVSSPATVQSPQTGEQAPTGFIGAPSVEDLKPTPEQREVLRRLLWWQEASKHSNFMIGPRPLPPDHRDEIIAELRARVSELEKEKRSAEERLERGAKLILQAADVLGDTVHLQALRAAIKEKDEALEPFAKAACRVEPYVGKEAIGAVSGKMSDIALISYEDLRRARSAKGMR